MGRMAEQSNVRAVAPDLLQTFPRWNGHVVDPQYIPKHARQERDAYVKRLGEWCRANRDRERDWPVWLRPFVNAEAERVRRAREEQLKHEGIAT